MEFFKNETKCINEKNDIICGKKHYFKHMKDSASNWYLLSVSDLMDLYRHHEEYVIKKCDWVCPSQNIRELHKKLRDLDDYTNSLRERNLTDKNEIIKTVALVFNRTCQYKEVFWWINLMEWEAIEVLENATMSWRARYY